MPAARRTRLLRAAALGALVAVSAACGSDDDAVEIPDIDAAEVTEVRYAFSDGTGPDDDFADIEINDRGATVTTDAGQRFFALSNEEWEQLVDAVLDAELPVDDSDCAGGPTNGLTVIASGETAFSISNNPCDDSSGFDALNDLMHPLLADSGVRL